MTDKNEKLLTIFLIFVCVYQLLFGLMAIISPGEAYRFQQVADNSRTFSKSTAQWWDEHIPHWIFYKYFNMCYVLLLFAVLMWQGQKKDKTT